MKHRFPIPVHPTRPPLLLILSASGAVLFCICLHIFLART